VKHSKDYSQVVLWHIPQHMLVDVHRDPKLGLMLQLQHKTRKIAEIP